MLAGVAHDALYCWTRSRDWRQSGLRGQITAPTFHPGGRTLAYCELPPYTAQRGWQTVDGERFAGVRLYPLTSAGEFEPDRLPLTPLGPPPPSPYVWLRGLVFAPDGQTLLTSRRERRGLFTPAETIIMHWHFTRAGDRWRVSDATPGRTVAERGAALLGESHLALAGEWGVQLCPLEPTTSPLAVPDLSKAWLVKVAPRGELVAAVDTRHLYVWQLRKENPRWRWRIAPQGVTALAFSPDGRMLAVGEGTQTVAFREPLSGGLVAEYDFGVGPVQSLAYAPDGLTLAVAGRDGLVVVDVG
jgi:WD40 repeat protein